MKTNYVLIDYENVQVKSLSLLKGDGFRVIVFLGPTNTKLPVELVLAMQDLGNKAEYVILEKSGANALDFHIAYYLGVLGSADPLGFFHIISKDTGFDPLIKHLKGRKVFSARSASIEEMPCFGAVAAASKPVPAPVVKEVKKKDSTSYTSCGELIKIAVDDLIKRKASKPRTQKTLLSTIHAKCGKDIPAKEIQSVFEGLVDRGYVKVNGTKITYALPAT